MKLIHVWFLRGKAVDLFFAPLTNRTFILQSMVVDLTVSNLLRASPTRSSRRLESFFQLQVCLFLPFPALLPLSCFNAANYSFSALVKINSTSLWSYFPWAFFFFHHYRECVLWLATLLGMGSASEKICCSHCCEVQKNWTRLLSRALGSSAMLSPYVYDLHFQALWSSDSENYINSSS